MNRILSTLFFLFLTSVAFAQKAYIKPKQPNPIKFDGYAVPQEWDSCHVTKARARNDIRQGESKYLVPSQLEPADKRETIYALILSKQFGIVPCNVMVYCNHNPKADYLGYDCYNEVVDSFYSAKYKTNFKNMVDKKVDSMIVNTKPAKLKKQYGYWWGKDKQFLGPSSPLLVSSPAPLIQVTENNV